LGESSPGAHCETDVFQKCTGGRLYIYLIVPMDAGGSDGSGGAAEMLMREMAVVMVYVGLLMLLVPMAVLMLMVRAVVLVMIVVPPLAFLMKAT